MNLQPLLSPKIGFPCVKNHAYFMPNVHWFLVLGVCVYFCYSSWTKTLVRLEIFIWYSCEQDFLRIILTQSTLKSAVLVALQNSVSEQSFPSGGGLRGSLPLTKKSACPPLFWPKNADFVIFMKFLAILPKFSPHQSTPFRKPCCVVLYRPISVSHFKVFEQFALINLSKSLFHSTY